jgi:DNA-binding transcriptional ArsR family regulator
MSDRNLRRYLKVLEDKNLIKFVQCGFKKAIVVNPEYYATGKDLDLETLKLFGLIECDDEKIESYL